ncbi:polysaccharide pyruvyl transferase family protein [Natronosalvus vescus]|uniref:polysaccharide pyruvyl transferase family protein n=1 Tax=Natronosalvus vescus TaxID=2953881 RepID=UPI002090BB77|nr:polysaccharide pyruvyl transferase family protein [Natronosalvus vescus]
MNGNHRKVTRNLSLVASVEREFLSNLVFPENSRPKSFDGRKNIAIVGGELFNKGAQAMTFTVVDHLSKTYPEKDIILLSAQDYHRPPHEKSQYTFEILPWDPEVHLSLLSPSITTVNTTEYPSRVMKQVRELFSSCACLIDISGYAFSSQFSFKRSFTYLTNLVIAKKFGIPLYIFPQSIGPFDYSTPKKLVFNPLMQTYLHYPEVICPRENAGVESLAPYTQSNVQRENDIVLQNKDYDLKNIYSSQPDIERRAIDPNGVGIVPNSKVFERADPEELYSLYDAAIEELLSKDRSVYILRHSVEDLDLCRNIKRRFRDDDRVVLIKEELNAIELEYIIDQFEFLIGSRYHSLIHAYKNHVPVIAIGWAVKYEELLKNFDQEEFFFEGRKQISVDEFIDAINRMSKQCSHESGVIETKVKSIQQDDLFSRLFGE